MKKEQLASWIVERADSITVMRDGVSKYFGKTSLFQHGSKYAPTVQEMRAWIRDYLKAHPQENATLLKTEFDRLGYQLIYTPPYECDTQPIEMLWAYVKNYVGRVMGDDHSIETVTELTRHGFYGDPVNSHLPVDEALCTRLIQHSQKFLNDFIKRDTELSGSLLHLGESFEGQVDGVMDEEDGAEEQDKELGNSDSSDEEEEDEED
jgi:hypothetical protein